MSAPRLRFKEFSRDWEEKTLEELALVERGKFSVRPRNDPRYFGGEIPFVQTGDVVFAGLYLTRFSQTLNEEGLKVSKLFPTNTVLITIAANIGDTTITKFDVACTDSVVAIQPYENMANSVWLKLTLDTKKDELDSKATQNAQKNINLQILKPLILHTPTFLEQTKIANFLTAIDEKITQLTQKADLLVRYKKGVMQQIFSQQLRFKDDDGQDFPDWENKKFGNVFSFIGTNSFSRELLTYEDGTVKNIHYGDIHTKFKSNFNIENENVPYIVNNVNISKISEDSYCREGDLIIADASEDYADIGKSIEIISIKNQRLLAGLHTYIARDLSNQIVLGYSGYLMQTENVRLQIKTLATGVSVLGISKGNLAKVNISVPSKPEQTKIASFLTSIDDKISHNQTQLNALKQYKQGLLQQLFV